MLAAEIYRNAQLQQELLNNLLEWARFQLDGNLHRENFDLSEVINKTVQLYTQQCDTKSIHVSNEFHQPIEIYGDREMIKTVIRNLHNNAIKFTNEGGRIHWHYSTTKTQVNIVISDTGVGMSNELLLVILAKNSDKNPQHGTAGEKGVGLGLELCRDFVEANGGTIRVSSAEHEGTTFQISLPLATA